MIRILQCVNDMHRAGLETMLMNYYRHIDRTQIQFDFLTHRPRKSDYDDEIISLGGRVYHAPRLYPQNYPKYFKWMRNFFAEHPEYKIVHSHIDVMSYLPLLAAKKVGVPVRIAHSHNTALEKDFKFLLKQYFRKKVNSVATHRFACGEAAGRFLFGKKSFEIIPNAVEAEKFYFDEAVRKQKRRELAIENKFVIGHVGRFCLQKNHEFLINIFDVVQRMAPDAVLLLVGVGEKLEQIKKQVFALGLETKVQFLGNRSDVNELYQAMDVFVLPSLFEGIPVVGVEAQFSDLPCLFSDRVPREVKFNRKSKFVDLDERSKFWANEILKTYGRGVRSKATQDIINSKYNINNSYIILQKCYIELNNNFAKN